MEKDERRLTSLVAGRSEPYHAWLPTCAMADDLQGDLAHRPAHRPARGGGGFPVVALKARPLVLRLAIEGGGGRGAEDKVRLCERVQGHGARRCVWRARRDREGRA